MTIFAPFPGWDSQATQLLQKGGIYGYIYLFTLRHTHTYMHTSIYICITIYNHIRTRLLWSLSNAAFAIWREEQILIFVADQLWKREHRPVLCLQTRNSSHTNTHNKNNTTHDTTRTTPQTTTQRT